MLKTFEIIWVWIMFTVTLNFTHMHVSEMYINRRF